MQIDLAFIYVNITEFEFELYATQPSLWSDSLSSKAFPTLHAKELSTMMIMIMTMMIKMIIAVTQSILKVRNSRFCTELDLDNI